MPYAAHHRLTLSGTLGQAIGGTEAFSFGVNLDKATGDAVQPNQAQFDDLVADSIAFFARPTTGIRAATLLRTVKLARIGVDGKYVERPFIAAVNQAGGATTGTIHAFQTALAVSLLTDGYGPTRKGRFYLPTPNAVVSEVDGSITAVAATNVRDSVVTWLEAINDEPGIDALNWGVAIASSKGYNTRVSGVRVGRVLDTIRSRRTSLLESYTATTGLATNV